jgi:ABC-type amino acid transport substrate-binding protein
MKNLWVIFLSVLLSLTLYHFLFNQSQQLGELNKTENTYDKVMRSGVIRCGYGLEPPMLQIDPNTGKPFGAIVDIVERIGSLLDLKIEWVEQVG